MYFVLSILHFLCCFGVGLTNDDNDDDDEMGYKSRDIPSML